MKVVLAGSSVSTFLDEKTPLLRALKTYGHDVTVLTAPCPRSSSKHCGDEASSALSAMGISLATFGPEKSRSTAFGRLASAFSLLKALRRLQPDVVLNCGLPQTISGSLITFFAGVNRQYALLSETDALLRKKTLCTRLTAPLRRLFCQWALAANRSVFFLTPDDRNTFTAQHLLPAATSHRLLNGLGVDIDRYTPAPHHGAPDSKNNPVFLCAARLIRDNGLEEFAEAARLVLQEHPQARFRLIGDGSAANVTISDSDLSLWKTWMEFSPTVENLKTELAEASVFVLPSYRHEIPHTALAALATALPLIAMDMPGCRETVLDGVNGHLVPPRNASTLAQAMVRCIREPETLAVMGAASRRYAEERFDSTTVCRSILKEMQLAQPDPEAIQPQAVLATKLKRAFDLAVTIPAGILFLPLIALLIWKVRRNISKDIFFRQSRPGKDGKLFRILKFKTMSDAVDADGNLLSDAERLVPLGRKLRAASLDELPELWNVITGEMSLVGPRPLLPQYLDRYSPRQKRRHEVRPGITGWAQINGRNAASWEERFEMDVWYVDNHSIWLDIRILFLTVWKVFRKEDVSHPGHATCPEFMGSDAAACNGQDMDTKAETAPRDQ